MRMFLKEEKSANQCTALILAGGHSSRMAFPKTWKKTSEGITFLNNIVRLYKNAGVLNVVVVLNEKFTREQWENELLEIKSSAILVKNSYPTKGRLYSLQLGLRFCPSKFVFIHNVDSPFTPSVVIDKILNQVEENGVTIPSFKGKGGHPVLISNAVKNEIINRYESYETLRDVFACFPKKYVAVENASVLQNINTPQDLALFNYEVVE
ncbi:MAG: hypothetical protein DWP98_00590 [Bacteroidetes bacterium]|nr:MAG: hypothetical protein DWP98_00590 [Bacteroidota bacterium]MBL1143311.1 hypothetical protein [Bacteroidota bacterium]NOG56113.1 NTP transferase domain-containing protein [Bacteroidota bacterium]